MALDIIRVVRERSDQGSRSLRQPRNFYCADEEDARCSNWEPNTDIFECEDHVVIRMELSGVSRDAISIRLKNGRLEIMGVRRESRPDQPIYYHQLEIPYGPFLKVLSIPEEIEHNDIAAVLNEGLLEVKISKTSQVVEIPISVDNREPQG